MGLSRFSLPLFVLAICSLAAPRLAAPQSAPSKRSSSNVRDIQQQYQKLIKDLYAEEANIEQRRALYGQRTIEDLHKTIDDLIGIIKITPPGEDTGESLSHYVEYFTRVKDVVDTAFEAMNGIADLKTYQNERDLRLQKLNDDLARANAAVRALVVVSDAVGHPSIKLKEFPYPEKDWKALDDAIDQMRKEDLLGIASEPAIDPRCSKYRGYASGVLKACMNVACMFNPCDPAQVAKCQSQYAHELAWEQKNIAECNARSKPPSSTKP